MISFSYSIKGHLRKSICMLNIWEKYCLLGSFHENKVISQIFFLPASSFVFLGMCSNARVNEWQSPWLNQYWVKLVCIHRCQYFCGSWIEFLKKVHWKYSRRDYSCLTEVIEIYLYRRLHFLYILRQEADLELPRLVSQLSGNKSKFTFFSRLLLGLISLQTQISIKRTLQSMSPSSWKPQI